jgi:hypothetical protein
MKTMAMPLLIILSFFVISAQGEEYQYKSHGKVYDMPHWKSTEATPVGKNFLLGIEGDIAREMIETLSENEVKIVSYNGRYGKMKLYEVRVKKNHAKVMESLKKIGNFINIVAIDKSYKLAKGQMDSQIGLRADGKAWMTIVFYTKDNKTYIKENIAWRADSISGVST